MVGTICFAYTYHLCVKVVVNENKVVKLFGRSRINTYFCIVKHTIID